MKKRYIVLSIILAVILILPKYISTQVKSSIDQYIAEVNKISGYNVEVVEFNEGWFSSNGKIKAKISLAAMSQNADMPWANDNPEVLLDFVSHHGPVMFTDGLDIGLNNWVLGYKGEILRNNLDWTKDTNFYQVSINTGLFGGLGMEDRVVPFTAVSKDATQNVVFSGYEGEGEQSGGEFSYEGEIEAFQFISDNGQFSVKDFVLSMESDGEIMAAIQGEMFDSNAALKIDKIEIIAADEMQQEQKVDVNKLSFIVDTDIDDEESLVNVSQKVNIKNISAMDYDVSDIELNVEVNRLSLVFLKAYQEFAKSISGLDELEMKQQSLGFFQQNLLPLLQSEPQINISKLSAKIPEGEIDGFSNNQLVGITALPDNAEDPKFWIQHTVSETELELDKDVANLLLNHYMVNQLQLNPQTAGMSPEEIKLIAAQQVPNMIEGLKMQGFIVEEDDELILKFSLKDGNAVLNGNAIPLPF